MADLEKALDALVERVAYKAGFTGNEDMTYKEVLQTKYEQKIRKMRGKLDRYKGKLGLKPKRTDFTEEIRTYLRDGMDELMAQGHSLEEAIRLTGEKFDEAELAESFDAFVKNFDEFGLGEEAMRNQWRQNEEAGGLIYGGFSTLGVALGGLIGFINMGPWYYIVIGVGAGAMIGTSIAMICNAVLIRKGK